jgi:CelD/BcsL family acetyltransferase involved in cellulose biosynthesis
MITTATPRSTPAQLEAGANNIQIESVPFDKLGDGEIADWSVLQRGDPAVANPFFRPEYTRLVSSVQPNIEVAVLRSAGRSVGFWPFQRGAHNVAHPPGMYLCKYQGVIAEPGLAWTPEELLRKCQLSMWRFDKLVASQAPMQRYHWSCTESAIIDLPSSFEDYCQQKKREGSETIQKMLRKRRSLQREVGPVKLVPFSDDERVLNAVIEWKRAQYRRIGCIDYLGEAWKRDLLRRIAAFRSPDFSGMLSALYAGDHLIAAHLGMQSHSVVEGWFPVYNTEFEKYSPGMIFWLALAEQAAELGIRKIDLGAGPERYKHSLKNGAVLSAEGAVDLRPVRRAVRKGLWLTRRALVASPLKRPLRHIMRSVRSLTMTPRMEEP